MQYPAKDIEVLVSTLNRTDLDFLYEMFPDGLWKDVSVLIINQTTQSGLKSPFPNVRVINSNEKGLSKSRNLALKNSIGDILLISDDDVIFRKTFLEDILAGFRTAQTDFVCFRYENRGQFTKKYPSALKLNLGWAELLSVTSVEIALKRSAFFKSKIFFDEKFGINASFAMGEEAIFLSDYKKEGFAVAFFPATLLSHNQSTTGQKIPQETVYFNSGAIFYRIFGRKWWRWILFKILADGKNGKVKSNSVFFLLNQALKGKKLYRRSAGFNDKR